jgi:hypothetical protein
MKTKRCDSTIFFVSPGSCANAFVLAAKAMKRKIILNVLISFKGVKDQKQVEIKQNFLNHHFSFIEKLTGKVSQKNHVKNLKDANEYKYKNE